MERITPTTRQVIIQRYETLDLCREVEGLFTAISNGPGYSLSEMTERFPLIVEFYNLLNKKI